MQRKKIGVLRGGTGEHYEKSLKKGGDLIIFFHENLKEKWEPVDILVDKENIWHTGGIPITPINLFHKVDAVWNTGHPSFSETLRNLGIPFLGENVMPAFLKDNRKILEEELKNIGIKMPRHVVLPVYQKDFDGPIERYSIKKAKEVHEKFSPPWIVKSFVADPNVAIHLVKIFPELVGAIEDVANHNESILVEEFIEGKEVQVHSLANFRDQDIYLFPFGNLTKEEKEKIDFMTREIFKYLGVPHYLKSGFKINSRGKIYFTNLDTDLSFSDPELSFVCQMVNAKVSHIAEHILERILKEA